MRRMTFLHAQAYRRSGGGFDIRTLFVDLKRMRFDLTRR